MGAISKASIIVAAHGGEWGFILPFMHPSAVGVEVRAFRFGKLCRYDGCDGQCFNPEQAAYMGRTMLTYNARNVSESVLPDNVANPSAWNFKNYHTKIAAAGLDLIVQEAVATQGKPMNLRGGLFGLRNLNEACYNDACAEPSQEDLMTSSRT